MTLQQLLQSYDFEEIFPEVGLMYPHARRKRKEFATAYMLLREMKPQVTKRQIRYQLMQDPNTNEMFFGADDACFAEKWAVLIGKEVKRRRRCGPYRHTDAGQLLAQLCADRQVSFSV